MIREYRSEDCEAVLGVWAAASAVAHPFLDEAFLAREREEIRRVHLPQAETWVWEADGRVVGFLSLVENEVAVMPEARDDLGDAVRQHGGAAASRAKPSGQLPDRLAVVQPGADVGFDEAFA